VGALLVVEDVVREVGADLQQQRPGRGGERRPRAQTVQTVGDGGPDQHGRERDGQRARADREDPGGEAARTDGAHGRVTSARNARTRAAKISGASRWAAWPAPGTTSIRARGSARASSAAIARNFASSSPTTSRTGTAISPSRSWSGVCAPAPMPRRLFARP